MPWLGVSLVVCGLVACRHPESPKGPGSGNLPGNLANSGDPATNVMIVPSWAAPGSTAGTNASAAAARSPSPFPDYDQRVAQSVYERWIALLKSETAVPRGGQVAVEFNLTSEGFVFGWRTVSADVPPRLQELCKRAILEVAPFPQWSPAMKKAVGKEVRAVRFTFRLNGQPQVP